MDGQRTALDRRGAPRLVADYEIRERLTRNPSSDTFLAVHTPTGTERVLYVLRPAAMQDRALVQLVACEIDAVRWVQHPSVPVVDPCGETEQGRLYFAVEHRIGESIADVVADRGNVDRETVVRLATRVVEALEQAHRVGIVHGRLTPTCIVLSPPDEAGRRAASILGLGASAAGARPIEGDELAFASPELLEHKPLDARSDVFALASVLQFALDGVPPLPALALQALTRANGAPPPSTTASVLAIARAVDPAQRYATVAAFWDDMLAALVRDARDASIAAQRRATPLAPIAAITPSMPSLHDDISALADSLIPLDLVPVESWGELTDDEPLTPTPDVWPDVMQNFVRAEPAPAPAPVPAPIVARPAPVLKPAPKFEPKLGPAFEREVAPRPTLAAPEAPAKSRTRRRLTIGLAVAACLTIAAVGAEAYNSLGTTTTAGETSRTPIAVPSDAPDAPVTAAAAHKQEAQAADSVHAERDSARRSVASVQISEVAIPQIDVAPVSKLPGELVNEDELRASPRISEANARREATRAVAAFANALTARDIRALERAAPEMSSTEHARWERVFHEASSVDAAVTVLDVQVDDSTITANVRSRIAVRGGKDGQGASERTSVAKLVRDASGSWRLQTAP